MVFLVKKKIIRHRISHLLKWEQVYVKPQLNFSLKQKNRIDKIIEFQFVFLKLSIFVIVIYPKIVKFSRFFQNVIYFSQELSVIVLNLFKFYKFHYILLKDQEILIEFSFCFVFAFYLLKFNQCEIIEIFQDFC